MKKILFMFVMMFTVMTVTAQTAISQSKVTDNTYVGAEVGATTPLSLTDVFPLNTTATLRVGKWLTPITALEVEGTAWFGSHTLDGTRFDGVNHNVVRGTYVGVNALTNLNNLFWGYKGSPRFFEVSTLVGLGWAHTFVPNDNVTSLNYLGAKTGVNLAFNLGKTKKHTLNLTPAVLWNLSEPGTSRGNLAFNKLGAQLYLGVGYTFHFKTSNGTHAFKSYNIGEYETTIANLNAELAKKPKEVIVEKVVEKEVPVTNAVATVNSGYVETTVYFEQGRAVLTDEAKAKLDNVSGTVTVNGYASPEGTVQRNQQLSEERANVVAEYLTSKGVTVVKAVGNGVNGVTSNRVVEIKTVGE